MNEDYLWGAGIGAGLGAGLGVAVSKNTKKGLVGGAIAGGVLGLAATWALNQLGQTLSKLPSAVNSLFPNQPPPSWTYNSQGQLVYASGANKGFQVSL